MFTEFITNYLRPVTFFQSVLIALFLFSLKKGNRKQNRLLALLFLSIGIMIGSRVFLWNSTSMDIYTTIYVIALDFRFLIAPLSYLYLKSIFKPSYKLKAWDLLHGSVFVIIVILQYFSKNFWLMPWKIFIVVDTLQIVIYLVWSFAEFKLIYLLLKPDYFKLDQKFIRWLQFFIISILLTLALLIAAWLMSFKIIEIENWNYWIARLAAFTNFIFMNTVVYIALKLPDLFISIKHKNGELPEEITKRYKAKLLHHMKTNKPYLNPLLSLNSLADEISVSPKHLSQIFNNSFQQNFYQFINSYRIEEVKKKLCKQTGAQNNSNILEIAYEAGFNSKNTFNSAFKKHTGMTPTEFKKQQDNVL